MKKPTNYIKGETFYHTFFRFLSFHLITKLLWNSTITPNQVTLFRNILTLISFYCFYLFDTYSFLIGFFLFQFAELLDSVDGDLARYKNMKSKIGIWLEIFFDAILTPVWGFIGLLFAYLSYQISGEWIYFLLWGVVAFSSNLEKSFYMHFRGCSSEFSEAKHDHIYFGFKGESFKTKVRNFLIFSKAWENQWLVYAGLLYTLFGVNLFLEVWIWLILLNQIHWIRLAWNGYKKALAFDS